MMLKFTHYIHMHAFNLSCFQGEVECELYWYHSPKTCRNFSELVSVFFLPFYPTSSILLFGILFFILFGIINSIIDSVKVILNEAIQLFTVILDKINKKHLLYFVKFSPIQNI